MTIIQALLLGVLYWLAVGNLPFVGLWSVQRPLVCGLIAGCILGDPVAGAVTGGTINLVYLGFISAGGSMPADMALAGILGTAYAIGWPFCRDRTCPCRAHRHSWHHRLVSAHDL